MIGSRQTLSRVPFTQSIGSMTTLTLPLLEAPASDETIVREPLAYVDAFDAVTNTDHALLAFKETHRASGVWWVRINALDGGHSVFHPNALRLQARAASAEGRSSFTWGRHRAPTPTDPRQLSLRVKVRHGEPVAVEMTLRLRRFDHTADESRVVTFPWPVL